MVSSVHNGFMWVATQIPIKIQEKSYWSAGDEVIVKHSTGDQSGWPFHKGNRVWNTIDTERSNLTKTEASIMSDIWSSSLERKGDIIWSPQEHWSLEHIPETCL